VNVGQSDHGPLHFCWIQADFQNSARSLPSQIELTAFPKNETLVLPPKPRGGASRAKWIRKFRMTPLLSPAAITLTNLRPKRAFVSHWLTLNNI
jgi:hypothetical protein